MTIILTTLPGLAAQQVEETFKDIMDVDQKFFESSILPEAKFVDETPQKKNELGSRSGHMPLFKKTRLKIQYALKMREKKAAEKRAKFLKPVSPYEVTDEDINDIEIDFYNSEFEGFDEEDNQLVNEKIESKQSINQSKNDVEIKDNTIVGGIRTQKTDNEMMLDCDNVNMNEDTGEIEAIGSPVLVLPSQGVKLTADKMIYNQNSNVLKAIGNVVLTKGNMPVYGDYIQINMNEENILMDNITAAPTAMNVRAKKALSENNKLILTDGSMYSEKSNKFNFITRMIGPLSTTFHGL